MAILLQNDFRGGMRRDTSNVDVTELADLSGMWHQNSDLEPMKGPSVLIPVTRAVDGFAPPCSALNDRGENVVYSHMPYVTDDGRTCIVARRDNSLWIAIPNTDYDRHYSDYGKGFFDMKDLTDNVYNRAGTGYLYNVGTVRNTLWSGNVRSFDSGSYLEDSDDAADIGAEVAANNFALEAWIRSPASNLGRAQPIISKHMATPTARGYALYLNASGYLIGSVYYDYSATPNPLYVLSTYAVNLCDGNWHHIVMTYTRGTGNYPVLYVDTPASGAAKTVTTEGTPGTWDITATGIHMSIGGYSPDTYNVSSAYFGGDIGSVSIYTRSSGTVLAGGTIRDHYVTELPRYVAPTAISYNWYPLHGHSMVANAAHNAVSYIRERSTACGETMVQIGANFICASNTPSEDDLPLAWRGTIIRRGLVKSDTVVAYSRPYTVSDTVYAQGLYNTGVLPGDTLYIKDYTLDATYGKWLLAGYPVTYVGYGSQMDFWVPSIAPATTGKGGGSSDYCEYCIVRTHRLGTQAGTTTTATLTAYTGVLPAGTYSYIWRYVNLTSRYYGKFSTPSTDLAVDGTKRIDISGWQTQPDDLGVNRLEIYRAEVVAGQIMPYYLVKAVNTHTTTGADGPNGADGTKYVSRTDLDATYSDTGAWTTVTGIDGTTLTTPTETTQLTDTTTEYYDRPGAISNVRVHNQRLYAVDGNLLRMGALDPGYEYMSDEDARTHKVTEAEYMGGTVQIGRSISEPVTAYIAEMGSYSTTGKTGSNLLVFTAERAMRWYGWSRSDFGLEEAFGVGSINQACMVNAGGFLIWNTGDRIVGLSIGNNHPESISDKLWPYGIQSYITAADKSACLKSWCAMFWNGWYLLSGSLSSTTPDTTWCYHLASGTWTSYPYGFHDLSQWELPGSTMRPILSGSVHGTGAISGLWQDSAVYNFSILTGPVAPSGGSIAEIFQDRHINQVKTAWKEAVGTAEFTQAVFVNGATAGSAAFSESLTVPTAGSATGQRGLVKSSQMAAIGWQVQLKISGTPTVGPRLEAILYDFGGHGSAT